MAGRIFSAFVWLFDVTFPVGRPLAITHRYRLTTGGDLSGNRYTGYVVLTDEIVRLAEHDDELLGVLFHEAGHVAHGHGLRRVIESSVLALLAMAYHGDADQVTAVAGGLPLAYAKSRYSREEELEADAAAYDGLSRHGKDTCHFARMLHALERASASADRELGHLSSPPATRERVLRFEAGTDSH
jgi:predicted Zn-dependent protease